MTPRVPERLGLDNPGDISIVGELLAKNGITAPEVVLKSVLRVDLEGDGTDEVLITASRMYGFRDENSVTPGIKAGDYSMIVMLKVVDGKVEAIPLILDTYPEEDIMARPWNASVMSVLDLNGDGDLEVVVSLRSFELGRTDVYEVTGDGLSQALTSGC